MKEKRPKGQKKGRKKENEEKRSRDSGGKTRNLLKKKQNKVDIERKEREGQ